MYFAIVFFAVIYALFVCGQVLEDQNKIPAIHNTSSVAAAYDELSCMHDSVYEILMELQYHLSEMHAQLNAQMLNIHSCGGAQHEGEGEEGEEEEETSTEDAAASEWDYEFPPGKIVPPSDTVEPSDTIEQH